MSDYIEGLIKVAKQETGDYKTAEQWAEELYHQNQSHADIMRLVGERDRLEDKLVEAINTNLEMQRAINEYRRQKLALFAASADLLTAHHNDLMNQFNKLYKNVQNTKEK